MALRIIRTDDDPILRKTAKEITEINDRIKELADDMLETMYDAEGVGLAGPQIGVLRRICVIDVGEGPVVMINPRITKQEGENIDFEGCLSFPEKAGKVARPEKCEVEFTDLEGDLCTAVGEGLMARAICHELDHLDGVCFVDKVIEDEEA